MPNIFLRVYLQYYNREVFRRMALIKLRRAAMVKKSGVPSQI